MQKFNLSEVNDALDLLREGNIQGRGDLIPKIEQLELNGCMMKEGD